MDQEDTIGDGIGDACACGVNTDCDDSLWCTGTERCERGSCVPGEPPCDDANPCTTDPCDEANDACSTKGCGATGPTDPCCNEQACEGADICEARVILEVSDACTGPGEIVEKSVCLDNRLGDLVRGMQFDLCEYNTGQPSDCMTCLDCAITERTTLFDCVVIELANGCCRVLLFSTSPAGLINPGLCDIVTVFELPINCSEKTCTEQIPENIVVSDDSGSQLPALGLPGDVCFLCVDDADCNDGLFCNGVETCEMSIGDPCPGENICLPGDDPCDDGLFCNGEEICDEENDSCTHSGNPCDDTNDCTDDTCSEDDDSCTNSCNVTSFYDPCCKDPACTGEAICIPQITLDQRDVFYNPSISEDTVVKKRVCLDNPDDLVGGIQFDECEYSLEGDPIDCMECIDCELTERTTMFDCEVLELPNGCCRVILFCKNPSCAVNPGLCDIVTIVFTMSPLSEECPGMDCEIQIAENIIASDYDGYRLTASGFPGTVCPYVCGDVCPPDDPLVTGWNCGDGIIDIFDVMCEVDFALTATSPDECQLQRADVPAGTPPNCSAPDGDISILDVLVLIDMSLMRQDCCTFYYTGIIY
jgi:hypothetical protein